MTKTPPLVLAIALSCVGHAHIVMAQTQPPGAAPDTASDGRLEQRTERILIEDAGSRIDELRVGGETRTITVSPKGGMPSYDILPSGSSRGPAGGQREASAPTGGTRVWKILGF